MADNEIMLQDSYFEVLNEVKTKIIETQNTVMNIANVERNMMYWHIGKVITEHASWGSKFVETLSKDLRLEYPNSKGFSVRNLNYMRQFAEIIATEEILQQGVAKINWRSITFLINQTDDLEEYLWYTNQCMEQGWSSNVLRHQIESNLYARQVLVDKTTNFRLC